MISPWSTKRLDFWVQSCRHLPGGVQTGEGPCTLLLRVARFKRENVLIIVIKKQMILVGRK